MSFDILDDGARDEMQLEPTNEHKQRTIRISLVALILVILVGLAWAGYRRIVARIREKADQRLVREVVASEELILALTPQLNRLSRAVLNLRFPDYQSVDLFADDVHISDLADDQPTRLPESYLGTTTFTWGLAKPIDKPAANLRIWSPLFDLCRFFENAKFYFIRGKFTNQELDEFESDIGFAGLAQTHLATWTAIRATHRVVWRRYEPASQQDTGWRIAEWHLRDFQTMERSRRLFSEVLHTAIPNKEHRKQATISRHRQILLENYFPGVPAKLPAGYRDSRFFPDSNAIHPGLSVVDIDDDGFDDLYVTVRWGRNQLWRNRSDGTFEEIAAKYDLDIEGRSSCALFADFDNDGDQDLMLGRTLEQSMYLVNEGGRFVDRSEVLALKLPFLVTSLSAADFNNDGLLDVYFSTYTPIIFNERFSQDRSQATVLANEYLSGPEATEFRSRYEQPHHRLFAEVGPPNLLLVNRGGGRFEVASQNNQVQAWRNTFQATWSDYDGDGDMDLYVANDFATDHLFRNDGIAGFVDVTEATGLSGMGFGMGASWGDYDNDGDHDLYVSNMYTKAGLRIIEQMQSIDPRFATAVEGNFLYRSDGHRFELVSGLQPPKLTVARAGWAWGGQFADVDNDGYLDLYVASGYYTVPAQHSTNIDL